MEETTNPVQDQPEDAPRKVTKVLTLQGLHSSDLLHGFKITTGIRGGMCGGGNGCSSSQLYTVGPNHNETRRR
jgi:hypothetical protein